MQTSKKGKDDLMQNQTLGSMIAALRKEKGMTQLDLAQQLGVTDKAVSKWERDLSCPDVNSLPKLAEILGVSVDELMQTKIKPAEEKREWSNIFDLILKAVPMAMGVVLVVLSVLKMELDVYSVAGFAGGWIVLPQSLPIPERQGINVQGCRLAVLHFLPLSTKKRLLGNG